MVEKRKTNQSQLVAHKKTKADEPVSGQLITSNSSGKEVFKAIKRTSLLSQPIMQLAGHQGAVLTCQFNIQYSSTNNACQPLLASAGTDKSILLWNAFGEVENYGMLKGGHSGAILQLQWSRDSSQIFSCSADSFVAIYDVASGERIKKFRGHQSIVNSLSTSKRGQEMICSVADDGYTKIWDTRAKDAVKSYEGKYPLLSTAFSRDGGLVYSAGIANDIAAWDLRRDAIVYTLKGHTDSVTGLRLSPNGDHLLSNSMDNTVCVWDVRPFSINDTRLERTFEGAPQGFEKNLLRPCWSPDADYIACGSGDRSVVIWDVSNGKMVYKLPGHKGCVNEVDWTGSILASGSNDQTLFLGELDLSEV